MNSVEPWYLKYLLPFIGSILIGVLSFSGSQLLFRIRDKTRSREKYSGYLRVIREEVKRNLDLLCQLHAYLYVRLFPTFNLSSFVNEEIFSRLTAVCLNHELLNKIFYRYFEYRHIRNRLDRIFKLLDEFEEITFRIPINQDSKHAVERTLKNEIEGTIRLIGENIRASLKAYNEITVEINSRDKKGILEELPSVYLQEKYDLFQKDDDVLRAEAEIIKLYPHLVLSKRPKFYIFPNSDRQ
ncbi:MAG: hypothetical protein V3W18_07000 [candidate division Zixibacteria bacterium]